MQAEEQALGAFLRHLAAAAPAFTWGEAHGRLWGRRGRRAWHCPITAVCFATTGVRMPVLKYGRAAKRLALPTRLAQAIAKAADDPTTAHVWLRRQLARRTRSSASPRAKTRRRRAPPR